MAFNILLLAPHCDKDEDHLLLPYVFALKCWFSLLQRVGLQHLCLEMDRFNRIFSGVVDLIQKDLNSFVILGAWSPEALQ
jgi:hypothetical protein